MEWHEKHLKWRLRLLASGRRLSWSQKDIAAVSHLLVRDAELPLERNDGDGALRYSGEAIPGVVEDIEELWESDDAPS